MDLLLYHPNRFNNRRHCRRCGDRAAAKQWGQDIGYFQPCDFFLLILCT